MILLIYTILESWVTKPQILTESGQVQVVNKYLMGYILYAQIVYIMWDYSILGCLKR